MEGTNVIFRVGKVKDGVESGEEQVEKDYGSLAAARATVIKKLTEKLTKGYVGRDAKKKEGPKPDKKETKVSRPEQKKNRAFSGDYYEKDNLAIKLEVNGKRVKITRIS